jgi:integrase
MKLTTTTVRTAALPAGTTDAIIFDDEIPGFGLRIREGGSKKFVFQYKLGTKQRRMALGAATSETVATARKNAAKLHARVKLGEDPASDKVERKREASETFLPAAEEFLEKKQADWRPGTLREVRRHLLSHAKPLHKLPVARITLRDVANVLATIKPVTANRVRSSLSVLFGWLIQAGRLDTNPVIKSGKNPEKPRDRVLSPAELKLIWDNLNGYQYGAIVKLLMLTGARSSEISGLRWDEISDGQIAFPAERVKNKRAFTLPLSPAAAEIIEQQPRRDGRELVFGTGRLSGSWSRCKEQLDEQITKANGKPLPAYTIHDIRRTVATGMAEIGVLPHVVECVLNHVGGFRAGVAGVYNRASFQKEMRDALLLWAEHLASIVGRPGKVTPLRKPA